jgi:hypothetical protein
MYEISPYRPFPSEMRADKSAAFCELSWPDGAGSTYVVVRGRRYLDESDQSMIERGVYSFEEMYPELEDLGRRPPEGTLWLYEVESFDVAKEHHVDQETFIDHSKNLKRAFFDNFDDAMTYCQGEFGIGLGDFRKEHETNYPDR